MCHASAPHWFNGVLPCTENPQRSNLSCACIEQTVACELGVCSPPLLNPCFDKNHKPAIAFVTVQNMQALVRYANQSMPCHLEMSEDHVKNTTPLCCYLNESVGVSFCCWFCFLLFERIVIRVRILTPITYRSNLIETAEMPAWNRRNFVRVHFGHFFSCAPVCLQILLFFQPFRTKE